MRCFWATVTFFVLAPALGLAQERSVVLEAPLEATLGDAISLILEVETTPTDEAAVVEQSLDPFEILDKKVEVEPSPEGTSKVFHFELRLISFETGEHSIGPIRVRITTSDGDLIDLESETKVVEVHSVLANEPNPELKPPTKPVIVEQEDDRLLIALGALAALALGALLAWLFMRWWGRRERPEPLPPPPPPPWETALDELRRQEQSRAEAIEEARTGPWVDAVSDTIRSYLGARFGFHGLESTTDEIAAALSRSKSLQIAPAEVVDFLSQCDLVKFAKASLADEASRQLIQDAFGLVERTRPDVQPDPEGTS